MQIVVVFFLRILNTNLVKIKFRCRLFPPDLLRSFNFSNTIVVHFSPSTLRINYSTFIVNVSGKMTVEIIVEWINDKRESFSLIFHSYVCEYPFVIFISKDRIRESSKSPRSIMQSRISDYHGYHHQMIFSWRFLIILHLLNFFLPPTLVFLV